MTLVLLVSGGLDSTVMAVLARQEGLETRSLFIDYGQLSGGREWDAVRKLHERHRLSVPVRVDVSGIGQLLSTGLTDAARDVFYDAFLPGRNLLFLLLGSAYAYHMSASGVGIGLLNESTHLFPDQTKGFLSTAEALIALALGRKIKIVAPLMHLFKSDVLRLAAHHRITGTYSCHAGGSHPCGRCISCREISQAEKEVS